MKVRLDNFKKEETSISPPLKHKKGSLNKTKTLTYDLFIDDLKVKSEINLFPLFFNESDIILTKNKELNLDLSNIDLKKPLFNMVSMKNLKTNELFSLEQALLSYLQKIKHEKVKEVFNRKKPSCLINDLSLDYTNKKNKLIKYKIGREDPKTENENIKNFIKNKNKLRLDGNQMLNHSLLKESLCDVDLSFIDYIEEPFPTIEQWNEFVRDKKYHQLSFALDENFSLYKNELNKVSQLKAIIIKPTRDLSISGLIKLYFDMKSNNENYDIILSSSFESELSLNTLIHLSELFDNHHGLGTYVYMRDAFKEITFQEERQQIIGYPLEENIKTKVL